MYRLGLEAILGLRREGKKLRIDPCIPKEWPGYTILYRHGETLYRISVGNQACVGRGVARVALDGEDLSGAEIPLVEDGLEHHVEVTLGPSGSSTRSR
jgi:cellobiose phosphorylase